MIIYYGLKKEKSTGITNLVPRNIWLNERK